MAVENAVDHKMQVPICGIFDFLQNYGQNGDATVCTHYSQLYNILEIDGRWILYERKKLHEVSKKFFIFVSSDTCISEAAVDTYCGDVSIVLGSCSHFLGFKSKCKDYGNENLWLCFLWCSGLYCGGRVWWYINHQHMLEVTLCSFPDCWIHSIAWFLAPEEEEQGAWCPNTVLLMGVNITLTSVGQAISPMWKTPATNYAWMMTMKL